LVEDPFAEQHRTDRHLSAGQRLGEQYHVRFDAPVLDRQETSGPPEAGLYFVGDEQGSVLAAQVERTLKIAVVRSDDALALNRLDDEGGDLA